MSRVDKKTRDAEKVAERRRSLTQAAITVITRKGLPGVTQADVACEVGCVYGLISFHFETKDRLLLAALDALIELDLGSPVIDAPHIAVWTAFWAETSRNPDCQARFGAPAKAYLARLEPLIGALAEDEPPAIDYRLVANGLSAMVEGLWTDSQISAEYGETERARVREICRSYLRAFFPRSFRREGLQD